MGGSEHNSPKLERARPKEKNAGHSNASPSNALSPAHRPIYSNESQSKYICTSSNSYGNIGHGCEPKALSAQFCPGAIPAGAVSRNRTSTQQPCGRPIDKSGFVAQPLLAVLRIRTARSPQLRGLAEDGLQLYKMNTCGKNPGGAEVRFCGQSEIRFHLTLAESHSCAKCASNCHGITLLQKK
jgi:hypothetical protein